MDDAVKSVISGTFREVLEKQVFLFAEPVSRGDFSPGALEFIAGSVSFRGEASGHLLLAVPLDMAREIAANFLGMEAGHPEVESQLPDALKELLNVAVGHVLGDLFGDRQVIELSIPQSGPITASSLRDLAETPEALPFMVDDHPLLLRAVINPPGGAAGKGAAR